MDAIFGALSDATRRLILAELVERNGQSLFEICGRLAMRHGIGSSRQTITRHLDVLESAGIVRSEWSGRSRLHYLERENLKLVHSWIADQLVTEQQEEL